MILNAQSELTFYRLGLLLKYLINISAPVIAVIVIIKCSIDMYNIVTNPDKAKDSFKMSISRLIASIIVLFLPLIIKETFKLIINYDDSAIVKYYENSSIEKIRELEIQVENERLAEQKLRAQKQEELNKKAKENGANSNPIVDNKNGNNDNNGSNVNNPQNAKNTQGTTPDNGQLPNIPENFKTSAMDAQTLLNNIPKNNVETTQVTVFASGKVLSSANYNTDTSARYPISSASKTMLGIVAVKMQDDNIIDLNTRIDTYWHALHTRNLYDSTADWQSYIGSAQTVISYTDPNNYLVENPTNLRNCLTHSSTIKNMNMVHMIPNDPSSEYFGGGMSKTYGRAAFMLKHTSHQLFEQGGVPGTTTSYQQTNDNITRDHALAGFTMQIAMKESLNEYLTANITSQVGSTSSPSFASGNSIYFASAYYSSAEDFAKIIATIANNGKYDGKQIFSENAINELEKVYSNLNNQTIAFDFQNNKYVKFGNFSSTNVLSNYGLNNEISKNATFITYDPATSIGFVVNIKYNNSEDKNNSINTFNQLSNYFYSNS